ncbi:unnamed protein product [Bursaphelenchus xylophilus]|uniref:(pine wood nematode) hypothetical protein n=1 Tax=Bursaphelenchus xylophilus TaxID=6326 RepID=A0A7I8XEZ0_BURXY|nr:unnamed protein product [Bursaphelenchus xylophilus]CAG9080604.1 unnamed protein product [Bursaphelenchus xylophilus]
MIANFDEEERTDAAKCLLGQLRTPYLNLFYTFQAHLMFDFNSTYKCDKKNLVSMDKVLVIVDEAGSSNDRDIHHLLNGNLNVPKLHCQSQ